MVSQLTIQYNLKIVDITKDGFFGIDPKSTDLFKQKVMVKDKFALKDNSYQKDDVVSIKIEVIEESNITNEIKEKQFFCVINEFTNNGFYTKHYKEYENRFMRKLFHEARGMMTFYNEDYARLEIGDILKINIRRLKYETEGS